MYMIKSHKFSFDALVCALVLSFFVEIASATCSLADICVTDLREDHCDPAFEIFVENSAVSGCCPSCQFNTGQPTPAPESTGCEAPSNCLPNGRYAPVQCKGDMFTGRCFCSDEHGNRIFGQMWRSEASEMTCACSRRRAELETSVTRGVTLHCTRTGDYEPLQCDNGMCWCAEPKTGQPTTIPILEEDMERLPCYSSAVVGEQYLRRCESIVHAQAMIHKEQSDHGTHFLGNPTTYCDYDGSYGPFQIQNGIAYCTGRDGEILGSWQIISSEMRGMNCNCARDTAVYFPERGMMVTELCQANGNYQANQNMGDVFYCVDTDGYMTQDGLMTEWPTDRCNRYDPTATNN